MNGLVKKFLEFAVGNGLVLIVGIISAPIVTRLVVDTELGYFSLFTMITSLIMLVAMVGSDQAYIRYFHNEEEENRLLLLKKCIVFPLIINVFVTIVLLLLYEPISIYIGKKPSLMLIILLVINNTFTIISNFVLIHIRMKQKAKTYSFLQLMNRIAYLLITCALFYFIKGDYIILVIATVAANVIMVLLGIFIERRDFKGISNKKKIKTSSKEIVKYGSPFIFSMAITWIFQSIDKVSIEAFSGSAQLGMYAASMQIVNILNTVQGTFTTFWTPVAYQHYSEKPDDKQFFIKINKIVAVVMLILAIGIIVCKDIIIYFLGPNYREAAFIVPFLSFMPIMYTISETTVLGINFKKKSKYHIYIAIVAAIANIVGNLLLVPLYGAKGAAISTGLAYIVFFVARTYFAKKLFDVKFELKGFAICTMGVYILAIVSSFYKFNWIICILGIGNILLVGVVYRGVISEIYNMLKIKFIEIKGRKK